MGIELTVIGMDCAVLVDDVEAGYSLPGGTQTYSNVPPIWKVPVMSRKYGVSLPILAIVHSELAVLPGCKGWAELTAKSKS